jgi:hypothetical protein
MAITEKEIFEMMFSGLGTGIGKDLTGTIKEFLEDPEKELTTLLKTEFPEETQQTIKKIAEGILERNDYSFIPQPKTKEQEEFSQKWEAAYKSTLEEYKKFTSDIFATLTRGSVFEQEHVTNRLEYKRQIKKITRLHPQCYSKEKKGFEERFERFEQNSPNRRTLEAMDMNMNLLYRLPKDSKACPVDAFAMRVKSPQRIAEKIARKWVMLIDKIETAKLEGKQYNARYDDLFLTDVFGFLVLQNKNKKFDDGTIYYAGNIKTIEDSDKKTEDKTKTQHRSKGQRQVKLADTTTGVIYDYHLFRTLGDWIDNEFSRKPTDTEAEKKPHEEYMKDKLRTVIKKNLSYQKVFDQITNRASTSLQNCHNEKITETTYQTYMRLEPNQKTAFLAEAQKKLEAKITELKYASKEEKRKKIGVTTIHSNLTEIVKCYNEEIRKTLNQDPETCDDQ